MSLSQVTNHPSNQSNELNYLSIPLTDLLDIVWLIAVILFTAMCLNILRRFLVTDDLKDRATSTSKADKWTANSRHLYQSLRVLAYSLTVLIVCLGILTALDIFKFSEDGLTLPLLYMIAVAAAETSKLWTVSAFARHPTLPIFLTALIALCISIFFASESLFNVSSQVQKHSNSTISKFLAERASNASSIKDYERQIHHLQNKEAKKAYPAQESEEFTRLQSSLRNLNTDINKFFTEKEEVLQANNRSSKEILNKEIATLQNLKNNTDDKIAEERVFFSNELEKLNRSRAEAVSTANFSRKRSVDGFYQERIAKLESTFRQKINSMEDISTEYRNKIEHTTTKAESLNKLSFDTKQSLKRLDKQIQKAEATKEQIVEKLNSISDQKDLDANILLNDIEDMQGLRNSLLEVQIQLEKRIAESKNENFLYVLASSFYGKPPLEVTAEEQMSFSFYFVGLGAIFLALLPSLLAVLSVMLEKAVEQPSSKRMDFKVLLIDCIKAINLSVKKGFNDLSLHKQTQNRLKISYESKIQKEKESAKKNSEMQREQFKRELLTKDNTITKLEKENYLRATEARHERDSVENMKGLKKLEKKVGNLQKLFETEEIAKKHEDKRRAFEEEQIAERRLIMQELIDLLEKRHGEDD